jgi:hypothetical protein
VWLCVFVDFIGCGCMYLWILLRVGVCMCGIYKVWLCVFVDFVMCGCVYVWILYSVVVCIFVCLDCGKCGCL